MAVIETQLFASLWKVQRFGAGHAHFADAGLWFSRPDDSSGTIAKQTRADEHARIVVEIHGRRTDL